jgi:hypothetical protein
MGKTMRGNEPAPGSSAEEWAKFVHECVDRGFDSAKARARVNIGATIGTIVGIVGLFVTLITVDNALISRLDAIDSNQKIMSSTLETHTTRLNNTGASLRQMKCIIMLDHKVIKPDQIVEVCGKPSEG